MHSARLICRTFSTHRRLSFQTGLSQSTTYSRHIRAWNSLPSMLIGLLIISPCDHRTKREGQDCRHTFRPPCRVDVVDIRVRIHSSNLRQLGTTHLSAVATRSSQADPLLFVARFHEADPRLHLFRQTEQIRTIHFQTTTTGRKNRTVAVHISFLMYFQTIVFTYDRYSPNIPQFRHTRFHAKWSYSQSCPRSWHFRFGKNAKYRRNQRGSICFSSYRGDSYGFICMGRRS
jgi:hypothetical protein